MGKPIHAANSQDTEKRGEISSENDPNVIRQRNAVNKNKM
jgi:hypothetical protein